MGDVQGLFVANDATIAENIGKRVYFGEILGKHSEVYGNLDESDLTVLSEDQDKIRWLVEVVGNGNSTISGYNPLAYIPEEELEDDEDE